MNWNKYIGIPWKHRGRDITTGLDCYGLVRYFYLEEMGFELPAYQKVYYTQDISGLSNTISQLDYFSHFHQVDQIEAGDIIFLLMRGYPIHMGIGVDRNHYLHSKRHQLSKIQELNRWSDQIDSIYRLNYC